MLHLKNIWYVKYYSLKNKYVFIASFFSMVLFGCKKDTANSLEALAQSMSGPVSSYVETGNQYSVNGILYHVTPSFVGLPVKLNKSAETEDTVFAEVMPSLVDTYNQLFTENNVAIPDSAFGVSHNGVFPVAAGATQTVDSLYAVLNDASQLVDSGVYLVPVRLTEKKSAGLQSSVVFFKMKIRKYGELSAMVDVTKPYDGLTLNAWKGGYLRSNFFQAIDGIVPGFTKIKLGVKLNLPFTGGHDLKVSSKVYNDSATIQSFVGTGYLPYPDNTLTVVKSEVTIPAGSLYSQDSIEIAINPQTQYVKYKSYMFIIELEESSDPAYAVPLQEGKKAAYMSLFTY